MSLVSLFRRRSPGSDTELCTHGKGRGHGMAMAAHRNLALEAQSIRAAQIYAAGASDFDQRAAGPAPDIGDVG